MPGLYTHITRATGTILTAAIYNSDHQNHIDNETPQMMDDYSTNVAQMKLQTDPGESGSESLSTSLSGEIERLRFILAEIKGTTWWYQTLAGGFAKPGSSNTFTATNTFQAAVLIDLLATIGTGLTVTGADNGAGGGPNTILKRTSASPAVNDLGAQLVWQMNDSGGGIDNVALIVPIIIDPTAGSEDSALAFYNIQAGVLTQVISMGAGLVIGNATGSYKGQGSINADEGYYADGHGLIVQTITTKNQVSSSPSTTTPQDNTIPQITEGNSLGVDTTITPLNANSIIEVTVGTTIGVGSEVGVCVALHKDAVANALASVWPFIRNAWAGSFTYTESAGSTSARTYRARAGAGSGAININGNAAGAVGGGTAVTFMTVREILPQ